MSNNATEGDVDSMSAVQIIQHAQVESTDVLSNDPFYLLALAHAEELDCLRRALFESVKLQSHYAELLNMHDGGRRMTFTVETWLARLAELDANNERLKRTRRASLPPDDMTNDPKPLG